MLGLAAYSAHNATAWLTSSLEKQGYKRAGGVEADSLEEALQDRSKKRDRVLLRNVSSARLSEMLAGKNPGPTGKAAPVKAIADENRGFLLAFPSG